MWQCCRLSKQFLPFMEPECLFSCSQNPSTESYLYSDESSRHSYTSLVQYHFNIIPHLRLNLPSHLCLSVVRDEVHYMLFICYIHATLTCCTPHLSGFDPSVLVKNTNYEAPHSAVLYSLLPPPFGSVCSQHPGLKQPQFVNLTLEGPCIIFAIYEGWNFNFGNASVTFDTAHLQSSYFHRPSMYSPKLCRTRSQR